MSSQAATATAATGLVDARGCAVAGATHDAMQAYEAALQAMLTWRAGTEDAIERALHAAPHFVMAHVLRAYLHVCSRDPRQLAVARDALAATVALPAGTHELRHLAVLGAVADDDYTRARNRLDECLDLEPRDVLALHVAQTIDHLNGHAPAMLRRVQRVLDARPTAFDGTATLQSMHAFALIEAGEHRHAECAARQLLQRDPLDVRTHHVMAHVFEMGERAEEGRQWFGEHMHRRGLDRVLTAHGWWHLALFELACGDPDAALHLHDRHLRTDSTAIAELIDATSLLWRVELRGVPAGPRWAALADAWAPRIDDLFCSFSDVHAMLAFVGAGDRAAAARLEQTLARAASAPTRHGATTRDIGLPACRGLMAYGRGDDAQAVRLLAGLPEATWRLGGSHAQRDVLYLTLARAVERLRERTRRPSFWREARLATAMA